MFNADVIKENKVDLQKAANKVATATPKTPNAFVTFAWNAMFDQLPTLLLAFAPKLITSKKSITILKKADAVIDQILEMVPEEEESEP